MAWMGVHNWHSSPLDQMPPSGDLRTQYIAAHPFIAWHGWGFCFQIMIFLFSDFFHNLGETHPSPSVHYPLFRRTTRGHAVLNVAVVASPLTPCMFPHFWVSMELMTAGGNGCGAECCAPPLKFLGSCIFESKEMSMTVINPVGHSPGMYKEAVLAGASLVRPLADPGPGFLFHYWA